MCHNFNSLAIIIYIRSNLTLVLVPISNLVQCVRNLGRGLKPTKTVLQLVDHSTRISRGMVEDVLSKGGEFVFLVDFVVLETEVVVCPKNKIPIILGQPFLFTSNALINCRDGKRKLNFGNITMELNVFNLQKRPMGFNDLERSTLN